MKKRYGYLVLVAIIILLFLYFSNDQAQGHFIRLSGWNKEVLDTLQGQGKEKVLLLAVNEHGCFLCEQFLEGITFPSKKYMGYYFNRNDHKLIWQTLRTRAFPTTYLFDGKFNILGEVEGTKNFNYRLEKTLRRSKEALQDSVYLMLHYSLQGTWFYQNGQFREAKKSFEKSLEYDSYFFNNYMLYLLSEDCNQKEFYGKRALSYNKPLDRYVYGDYIHDLTFVYDEKK